jgi:hypothetical protein
MENLTHHKNRPNKNKKQVRLERAVSLFLNKTKQYQT